MRPRALLGGGGLAGAVIVGGSILGTGCSPVDTVKPYRELAAKVDKTAVSTWPMFPVALDDVYRVVASAGGKSVEVQRTGGGLWEPGTGAAPAAGSLMSAAGQHLIPMPAYRRLDVDPASDPGFGFAGSDVALTVETQTAQRFTIHFGGPNPTGGGYYVRRDGDPFVYVVVDQVFDEVRSLVAGTEIVRPDDPRVQKVLADDAKSEDPEEVTNPWLGQVLASSH
ncbi:MAG: hypothetical protein QOE80_4044 [Actinomycetota bacterium]|jgi:hypothetical protein|nr:hypothetical protein [Actinomycetota bacterium]